MTLQTLRPAALDALEATARQAAVDESALREGFAREIARLEVARRRAYRRFNFLSALVAADAEAEDREASRAVQLRAAADQLEWEDGDPRLPEMLAAFEALADAVYDERNLETVEAAEAEAQPETETDPQTMPVAYEDTPAVARETGLLLALAAFEAQYEALGGRPFVELFDRYMPETPLVDF